MIDGQAQAQPQQLSLSGRAMEITSNTNSTRKMQATTAKQFRQSKVNKKLLLNRIQLHRFTSMTQKGQDWQKLLNIQTLPLVVQL